MHVLHVNMTIVYCTPWKDCFFHHSVTCWGQGLPAFHFCSYCISTWVSFQPNYNFCSHQAHYFRKSFKVSTFNTQHKLSAQNAAQNTMFFFKSGRLANYEKKWKWSVETRISKLLKNRDGILLKSKWKNHMTDLISVKILRTSYNVAQQCVFPQHAFIQWYVMSQMCPIAPSVSSASRNWWHTSGAWGCVSALTSGNLMPTAPAYETIWWWSEGPYIFISKNCNLYLSVFWSTSLSQGSCTSQFPSVRQRVVIKM